MIEDSAEGTTFAMKNDAADSVSQRMKTRPAGLISTAPPSSLQQHTAHERCRAPTADIAAIRNDHVILP